MIAEALRRRVRDRGAEPLITYYDVQSGERTELSAVSFANWVNKTSNLLVDELMIEPGTAVELLLAEDHPGHWVTMIWELACWQVGAVVSIGGALESPVLVIGPDTGRLAGDRAQIVSCSLHPLGLPGSGGGPGRVLDYNLEVRGQADQYAAVTPLGSAPAWNDGARVLDQAELVAGAPQPSGRRLIIPSDPWTTAYQALIGPLVVGGSSVIVAGAADPDHLDRIRTTELAS